LYVSAFQSFLFNKVVSDRILELNKVKKGDLAWKHDKGVVFSVEDEDVENVRSLNGEISPSGPMFGNRMSTAHGYAGKYESDLLEEQHLSIADFPSSGPYRCTGGRRPLRFFPKDPSASSSEDEFGEYIEISFGLESGSYATVVLREICKDLLKEN